MAKLFVMVGCPGCGKTTFIEKYKNANAVHVSRDAIRYSLLKEGDHYFDREKQVFQTFVNQINTFLLAGYDVYADATHLNLQSRAKLLRQIYAKREETVAIYLKTSLNVCCQRNAQRSGFALVPEHKLENMYFSLVEPTINEGFNRIIVVDND